MDSTGDLRVSLLMGRWSFWLRVPSLRYLGRNHTGSPGPLVPFLLTSQTLLCLWSSAQLRSASFYPRVSSGVCRLICSHHPPRPIHPFLLFPSFPRRCGGRGEQEGMKHTWGDLSFSSVSSGTPVPFGDHTGHTSACRSRASWSSSKVWHLACSGAPSSTPDLGGALPLVPGGRCEWQSSHRGHFSARKRARVRRD